MKRAALALGLLVLMAGWGCGQKEAAATASGSETAPVKAAAVSPKTASAPKPTAAKLPTTAKKAKPNPTPADLVQQVIVAADTKLKRGDAAGAVKLYNQAMRMDPKGHVPFQRLCVHYVKANPELALPHCREWFQREPDEPTKKGIVPILFQLKAKTAAKK